MSTWSQSSLNVYVSTNAPELTFYYVPLTGQKQVYFRQKFGEFESISDLMETLFSTRVFLFTVRAGESESTFIWPKSPDKRTSILRNIDDPIVVEVGAAILGWRRGTEEDPQIFYDRIVRDLRDANDVQR